MFAPQFDAMQKLGKDQLDTATKTFDIASKGAQTVAVEVADYSKRAFETGSATFEKLLGARTLDKAIEVQTDYARTAYDAFVGYTTRLGEVFTSVAKDVAQPVQALVTQATTQATTNFQQAQDFARNAAASVPAANAK